LHPIGSSGKNIFKRFRNQNKEIRKTIKTNLNNNSKGYPSDQLTESAYLNIRNKQMQALRRTFTAEDRIDMYDLLINDMGLGFTQAGVFEKMGFLSESTVNQSIHK
jgi:hypothetical protein